MKTHDIPYYAFRGPEILVRSGEGVAALRGNPYPELSLNENGPLLDSFPLRVAPDPRDGEKGGIPLVLSLAPDTDPPEGCAWMAFRGIIGTALPRELSSAYRALALLNWRITTRFCGRCGAPQGDKPDETARLCPHCGLVTYPRLSPAVLALVRKDDRILLARNASFRGGIFSILAGFVEAGESFEECVAREVSEEVGIQVKNIRYRGSQPWPFPDSLMVGFEAEWESGDLRPDGLEIAEAGWYGREAHPPLPLHGSLSRSLIDGAWGVDKETPR